MGWVMLSLGLLGILTGIVFLVVEKFIGGGIFIVFFGYLLLGLKSIPQQERALVELFGKYVKTLKPGLQWIFPGIMTIRAAVPIWELTVPLFEEEVKIDLKDGSVQPKGAEVFVKMQSPDEPFRAVEEEKFKTGAYRAVYEIDDWEKRIKDILENAVRTYLNRLTIDQAITLAKPGYDLVSQEKKAKGLPNEEIEKLKKILSQWGFELLRVTVQDFELEPALVEARGRVQIRQREAEAAKFVARRRAEEIFGAIIEMLARSRGKGSQEIVREIDEDAELRKEFLELAKDLLARRMAIDGDSFVDVRVGGAEGLERTLLNALATWQKIPKGDRNEGDT